MRIRSTKTGNCILDESRQGVLVIGAGWIGRQVALRMALCGLQVQLLDKHAGVLASARAWAQANSAAYLSTIRDEAQRVSFAPHGEFRFDEKSAANWQDRFQLVEQLTAVGPSVAVVLECVPEQVALKRRVLKEASQTFPRDIIIASNSSYFTPSNLSKFVEHPERFAHWHFHVPLERASIADICGSPATEPWVTEKLLELSVMIGQYPLVLRHEHSGYVFNWLLQSVLRGALELAAQDVVDPAEIDRAWVSVSKMPIGPFAMMDHIGLDVIEQVLSNARWANTPSVPIESLIAILRPAIEKGNLGVKTGRGFYDYTGSES